MIDTEEAVELLGQSGTAETRVLLSQAGIQVADTVPTSSTGTPTVQVSNVYMENPENKIFCGWKRNLGLRALASVPNMQHFVKKT